MIKATELRIGNWFINSDGEYEQVYSIETDGINSFAPMYDPMDKTYEPAKPIPLTSELLEKCGFVNKPTKNYPLSFEQDNGDRDLDWTFRIWWWRDDICVEPFGRDNGHIGIQYLHQLQNLYFALTGTELTVNLGTTVEAS